METERGPRWRRWLTRVICWSLLAGGAGLAQLPAIVESPGRAIEVRDRVTVGIEAEVVRGELRFLTVRNQRATPWLLVIAVLDGDRGVRELRPAQEGISDRAYHERQRTVFAASSSTAMLVGLDLAGLGVGPDNMEGDGAEVVDVVEDGPAWGLVEPGDLIIGVDGLPVPTVAALREAIAEAPEGRIEVQLRRGGEDVFIDVEPDVFTVGGEEARGIGVIAETRNPRTPLPVPVDIDGGRVGGPSAGLMLALAVYDAATEADLTSGMRVSGTGTIEPGGGVGRVGGVPRKTVTAHRAGSDVMLVPMAQLDEALDALPAGSRMQVVGVETITDALAGLRRIAAER